MDICTIIFATTMTLQACYSKDICHPSADGTKQMCSGVFSIPCDVRSKWPTYDCKRPDGSTYLFTDEGMTQGGAIVLPDAMIGTTSK